MKKTIRKTAALLSAAALMLTLCACGSDYPVLERKLDVSGFINACFEGSGYSPELEDADVTVSAVADRMSIDMEKSQDTVEAVRSAIRSAATASDGLCGMWTGNVDISGVICDNFRDIEGLELDSCMGAVPVRAELRFAENGIYMLRFDEKELDNVRQSILNAAAKAVKDYLSAQSDGAARLLIRAIDEDTLATLLSYEADVILDMLKNGAAGYYSFQNGFILFEKQGSCQYRLTGDLLTLSDGTGSGLIRTVTSGNYVFTRK